MQILFHYESLSLVLNFFVPRGTKIFLFFFFNIRDGDINGFVFVSCIKKIGILIPFPVLFLWVWQGR